MEEYNESKLRELGFENRKYWEFGLKKDLGEGIEVIAIRDIRTGEPIFTVSCWLKYVFKTKINKKDINKMIRKATISIKECIIKVEGI